MRTVPRLEGYAGLPPERPLQQHTVHTQWVGVGYAACQRNSRGTQVNMNAVHVGVSMSAGRAGLWRVSSATPCSSERSGRGTVSGWRGVLVLSGIFVSLNPIVRYYVQIEAG